MNSNVILANEPDDLIKKAKEYRLLLKLSYGIATSKNIKDSFDFTLKTICTEADWDCADGWVVDFDKKLIRCIATYYKDETQELKEFVENSKEKTFQKGEDIIGNSWQTKNSNWVEDVCKEENFSRKDIASKAGIHTMFCLPVPLNGEPIALMGFYRTSQQKEDTELVELLIAAGGQLGMLIKQKETEQFLRHSELRFRTLIESSPEAIIISNEFLKIISFNKAAQQMFNLSESEVMGESICSLIPQKLKKDYLSRLNPENENGVNFLLEYFGIRNDDSEFPIEISVASWEVEGRKFYSNIVRDITDRINKEKKVAELLRDVRRNETLYRAVASNIPEGIVIVADKDLKCLVVEGQALSQFGISKNDLEGCLFNDAATTDLKDIFATVIQSALNGKYKSMETLSKKGRWFRIDGLPFKVEQENIEGIMLLGFDIDDLKRAGSVLANTADELSAKNLELEQFAYVASHDLQEPLRMVSSYTQLLSQKYASQLDADAQEFIKYAVEGATRMQGLISDLLSYSRIGRKDFNIEKIDFADVVEEAKLNLSVLINETNTNIYYNNLPEVTGDRTQLVQLMQNLLSNGIKFRNKDIAPEIKIEATENEKEWCLKITDNGIGIDEKFHERIFQIFQRLHTREKIEGTGIGLALSKKIVERHGGNIDVDSSQGHGATFSFSLSKKNNYLL